MEVKTAQSILIEGTYHIENNRVILFRKHLEDSPYCTALVSHGPYANPEHLPLQMMSSKLSSDHDNSTVQVCLNKI